MQSVGGDASSLELAGAGLMLQAEGAGGGLDYSVTDVVAISGTGGYGNAALSASDPARAINVVMTGGALGNTFFNAARFDSPGSSSSLTGVTVRSAGDGVSGWRRNAEDRPQQRAGPYGPERDGQRRERQGGGGRQRVRDAHCRRRRACDLSRNGRRRQQHSDRPRLHLLARRTGASAGIELFKARATPAPSAADLLNTIVPTESTIPTPTISTPERRDGHSRFLELHDPRNLPGGTTSAAREREQPVRRPRVHEQCRRRSDAPADSPLIDAATGDRTPRGARRGRQPAVARRQRRLRGAVPDIGAFKRPELPAGRAPEHAPTITRFAMTTRSSRRSARGPRPAAGSRSAGPNSANTLSEAARVTITIDAAGAGTRPATAVLAGSPRRRRVAASPLASRAGSRAGRCAPAGTAPASSRWTRSGPARARAACVSGSSAPSARARPACVSP